MDWNGATGPVLITERFELWRPRQGDLADLISLTDHPETRRFLGLGKHDTKSVFERMERNAGGWALHGLGTFYVRRKGETRIIGNCGIFRSWRGFGKGMDDVPEATWILRHDAAGQRVAQEVMQAALPWFETAHGRQRITCMISEGNIASERIAAGLGFRSYDRHILAAVGGAEALTLSSASDRFGGAAMAPRTLPRPSAGQSSALKGRFVGAGGTANLIDGHLDVRGGNVLAGFIQFLECSVQLRYE